MKRTLFWMALALAFASTAPARAQDKPNPCTLAELEEALGSGGIGGTGILAQEGGIGGTGIVGTVTGFGSVCVNGVEVQYDAAVPVVANGLPADAAQLAIGQAIAVEVVYTQKGLEAKSIEILGTRAWSFAPGVTRVWIEGSFEPQPDGGALASFGRRLRLAADVRRSGGAPEAGSRMFVLAAIGADGTVVAQRLVVPKQAKPSATPPQRPVERRTFEPPRELRIEPRFEPRMPGPPPSMPGRMGR